MQSPPADVELLGNFGGGRGKYGTSIRSNKGAESKERCNHDPISVRIANRRKPAIEHIPPAHRPVVGVHGVVGSIELDHVHFRIRESRRIWPSTPHWQPFLFLNAISV